MHRLAALLLFLVLGLSGCGGGSAGASVFTGWQVWFAKPAATPATPDSAPGGTPTTPGAPDTPSTPDTPNAPDTAGSDAPAMPQAPRTVLESGIRLIAGSPGGPGSSDGDPTQASLDQPGAMTMDRAGNLYFADNGTIRKVTPQRVTTTLAGAHGQPGFVDGTGTNARVDARNIAVDPSGTIFFTQPHAVRKLTPDGVVTTLAGIAPVEPAWDPTDPDPMHLPKPIPTAAVDGPLASARFKDLANGPIVVDTGGNLYVGDGNAIRRISPAGEVTTYAGLVEIEGDQDGPAAAARFGHVYGLAIDAADTLYVRDYNVGIRKLSASGVVSTLAVHPPGLGGALTVDRTGTLWLAAGEVVRRVAPDGIVTTLDLPPSGSSGRERLPTLGYLSETVMWPPWPPFALRSWSGIASDADGNLYVSDWVQNVIERIAPGGQLSVWVGRPFSLTPVDGPGAQARFALVARALAADAQGNAYVADDSGHAIRKVAPDGTTSTLVRNLPDLGAAAGLATDAGGTLYIANGTAEVIQKIGPAGVLDSFAGPGSRRGSSIDGPAAQASFAIPHALAVDSDGTMYVADWNSKLVRKIAPGGEVSTLAGSPWRWGTTDGTGSAALFLSPSRIFVGPQHEIYVSSFHMGGLRRITPAGVVTTIAQGEGITWHAADAAGNLYGTDKLDSKRGSVLYKLTPAGVLRPVAGAPGSVGVRTGPLPGSLGVIAGIAALPPLPDTIGTRLLVLTDDALVLVTLSE